MQGHMHLSILYKLLLILDIHEGALVREGQSLICTTSFTSMKLLYIKETEHALLISDS